MTNQIIVKLKSNINIKNILDEYKLILIRKLGTKTYLVKVEDIYSVLDVSNNLYEDSRTIHAQPNFMTEVKKR